MRQAEGTRSVTAVNRCKETDTTTVRDSDVGNNGVGFGEGVMVEGGGVHVQLVTLKMRRAEDSRSVTGGQSPFRDLTHNLRINFVFRTRRNI